MKKRAKRNRHESRDLDHKLAAYSVAAGAAAALAGGRADAAVMYTTANITLSDPDVPNLTTIDIDGDAKGDFALDFFRTPLGGRKAVSLLPYSYSIDVGFNKIAFGKEIDPGFFQVRKFVKSSTLIADFFVASTTPPKDFYVVGGTSNGVWGGDFAGERAYAGVKFKAPDGWHIGALDLELSTDNDGTHTVTLHGWAYQTDVAGPANPPSLHLCDVPDGGGTLAQLAMGAAGLMAMRRRRRAAKTDET